MGARLSWLWGKFFRELAVSVIMRLNLRQLLLLAHCMAATVATTSIAASALEQGLGLAPTVNEHALHTGECTSLNCSGHGSDGGRGRKALRFCVLDDPSRTPELFLQRAQEVLSGFENGGVLYNFFAYGRDRGASPQNTKLLLLLYSLQHSLAPSVAQQHLVT